MKTIFLTLLSTLLLGQIVFAEPLTARSVFPINRNSSKKTPSQIIALEGVIFFVGKTGLRITDPKWKNPTNPTVESADGQHYIWVSTKNAGFTKGQRISIYVADGGFIEWNRMMFKRWNAVSADDLPKGFKIPFPSEISK